MQTFKQFFFAIFFFAVVKAYLCTDEFKEIIAIQGNDF
jgi:hypothetical protein